MSWASFFSYKDNKRGIWADINFIFSYAAFLWFASDEDLAWLNYYARKSNMRSALASAYQKIPENRDAHKNEARDKQIAYNSGCRAAWSYDWIGHVGEYWDETERWQHYGYSHEEIERRRMKPEYSNWRPTREERMREPIVYEKAIREDIWVVFRDKIGGKYTAYIIDNVFINDIKEVKYVEIEHISDYFKLYSESIIKSKIYEMDSWYGRAGERQFSVKPQDCSYSIEGRSIPGKLNHFNFSIALVGYNVGEKYVILNKTTGVREILKSDQGYLTLVYVRVSNESQIKRMNISLENFWLENGEECILHDPSIWRKFVKYSLMVNKGILFYGNTSILAIPYILKSPAEPKKMKLVYRPSNDVPRMELSLGERQPWREFEKSVRRCVGEVIVQKR